MTLADYGYSPEPFAKLFILFVLLLSVITVLGVVIYILHSLAYYEMSKTLKFKKDWYGFVPFLRDMSCGNIASEKENSTFGKILTALSVCFSISMLIYVIFSGISFINLIFEADAAMVDGLTALPKDALNSFKIFSFQNILLLTFGLAYKVMRIVGEFKIYRKFAPAYSVVFLIVGLIIPVATPIILYSIRKKMPYKDEPPKATFDFSV